jgi:hypothetical protein
VPEPTAALLLRLIGDDPTAADAVVSAAPTSTSPPLLVAAALLTSSPPLLDRAATLADNSRDRQLVALGEAYLAGDADRLDVLVRDHLSDHPDHLLASWIAGQPAPTPPTERPSP